MSIFAMLSEYAGEVAGSAGESILDKITTSLGNFFGTLMYYIVAFLCSFVNVIYKLFGVFSGINRAEYDGETKYLINIFFSNKSINNVYWGMALIGFAMIFAFAIIAVIRKIFDINDKNQRSLGTILLGVFKSSLIILVMSLCVTASLNAVNILVQQVSYIFDNADSLDKKESIVYTDEQFAAMARIFNTIGNYSLNPSYNSRYNINCCYNEIRGDLYYLKREGVFEYYYQTVDPETGKEVVTWQSALQDIYRAADVRYDQLLDVPNATLSKTITDVMDRLRTDGSFEPLSSYRRTFTVEETVPIDRVIFLMGTLDSALNTAYNAEPALDDDLRGPFMNGQKNIYAFSDVRNAFDVGLGGISYLLIILLAYFTIKNLLQCLFSCIARIVSLIGLYLVSPPFAATIPLDDGERFKQWTAACVVQMFGIFGNIIPMRLVIMFIPLIFGSNLVLIPGSPIINVIAKSVLLIGMLEASGRFSGIFNGILANSGGFASAQATNMNEFSARAFGMINTLTGVSTVQRGLSSRILGSSQEHYGLLGGALTGFSTPETERRKFEEEQRSKGASLPSNYGASQPQPNPDEYTHHNISNNTLPPPELMPK